MLGGGGGGGVGVGGGGVSDFRNEAEDFSVCVCILLCSVGASLCV